MSAPVRVAHVIGNLGLGGAMKLTAQVAAGLQAPDFDSRVCVLGRAGHYGEALRREGVEVLELGLERAARSLPFAPLALLRLRRWLAGFRPDVVHSHMTFSGLFAGLGGLALGARHVRTLHRVFREYGPLQPAVERLLAPGVARYVVDSEAVRELLTREYAVAPDRIDVIYDAVDPAEYADAPDRAAARLRIGLAPGAWVVGSVAFFVAEKGHEHLLRAFARVARPGDRLLLVGHGPLEARLRSLAAELGLGDALLILPTTPRIADVYPALDVFALTSSWEGFGIAQAEAMWFGLPVVGTDFGGAREVVANGETGTLVPFGDVDAIAAALAALRDPATARRLGEAGRARVESRFTVARLRAAYRDFYLRLLGRAAGGAA